MKINNDAVQQIINPKATQPKPAEADTKVVDKKVEETTTDNKVEKSTGNNIDIYA